MAKPKITLELPLTTETPSPKPKTDNQRVPALQAALISITLLFMITAITLFALYKLGVHNAKGPEVAATSFVLAVQNDDPKTAYNLTSTSFKASVNESGFTKILTAQNAVIGTGKVTVVDSKTKTSDGFVTATLGVNIGSGADTTSATLLLAKTDNVWYVANISQFSKGPYSGSTLDPSQ